jgi:hypothetical protein
MQKTKRAFVSLIELTHERLKGKVALGKPRKIQLHFAAGHRTLGKSSILLRPLPGPSCPRILIQIRIRQLAIMGPTSSLFRMLPPLFHTIITPRQIFQEPGQTLYPGVHNVRYIASDAAGNRAECHFTIHVRGALNFPPLVIGASHNFSPLVIHRLL